MNLELPSGVTIDEVEYEISGNGITPIGGLIDTAGPGTTVSFSVLVPGGQDYLLGLNAESTDGGHSCRGTAPFDMQAGQTTNVSVTLTCKRTGDLHVGGGFNHCAEVSQPFVSATQMTVGDSIQLSVVGVDEENDPIEYNWIGGGGIFDTPDAAATNYSCAEAGMHTLGVVLSDDGFTECAEGWTTDIECAEGSPTYPTDAILVSTSGLDGPLCGTDPADPCATITYGIVRANSEPSMNGVAVSGGTYNEHVVLLDGVDILGGYSPDFSTRDIATFLTTLRVDPNTPETVTAQNITVETIFEGFTVLAPSNNQPSMDSIGVHVSDSTSALRIENNVIVGGAAGDGANGLSGTNGTNGFSGQYGVASIRVYTSDPDPGPLAGGLGGTGIFGGFDLSGGDGGASVYPVAGQQNTRGDGGSGYLVGSDGGDGGFNWSMDAAACGVFNTGGRPHYGIDGEHGQDGDDGLRGVAGLAGVGLANAGGDGQDGAPGVGGGGGGAAGGLDPDPICETAAPLVVLGGSGGGGGSGASPGTGGQGAGGGGAAIGILVDGTGVPTIVGNAVYLGAGGDGGVGGPGGVGGLGGHGGFGGAADEPYAGAAGDGGKGGNGGHGGGGGGGAGGLSIGIYATFDATGTYDVDNLLDVGTGIAGLGGAGGPSVGNSGEPGQDGQVLAVLFQP